MARNNIDTSLDVTNVKYKVDCDQCGSPMISDSFMEDGFEFDCNICTNYDCSNWC